MEAIGCETVIAEGEDLGVELVKSLVVKPEYHAF